MSNDEDLLVADIPVRGRVSNQLTPDQATHMHAWIQALRSGDYVQTQSRLRTPVYVGDQRKTGYCCLGVAAEVAITQGCPIAWGTNSITSNTIGSIGSIGSDNTGYHDSSGSLAIGPMIEWFGFAGKYAAIEVPCKMLGRRGTRNPCIGYRFGHHDPHTCARPAFVEATSLNDHYKWGFGQIASAFEDFYFPAASDGE
jgi:hypothetical protein